jgi:hypothetical protein
MTRLELIHELPGRMRLRFQPPLPVHQAMGLQERLSSTWPGLTFRLWGLGQGLVVYNGSVPLSPDLIDELTALVSEPVEHTPHWRDSLIEALMVLAILGWALPVLPGTPFFLLALALRGWRR